MQFPEADDPWGSPDLHKNHGHPVSQTPQTNGASSNNHDTNGRLPYDAPVEEPAIAPRTTSSYTTASNASAVEPTRQQTASSASPAAAGGWGYFDGTNPAVGGGFGEPAAPSQQITSPFGSAAGNSGRDAPSGLPDLPSLRASPSGRTGSSVEEHIVVSLMPEKEGLFFFQHHNYEVSSPRRGSKVVRRYSDFVWLLDCLHKRYPFRVLPLLPPKRVAVNGNHLSNDGAFIEKRRRGLARFLNALVRHPILGQEQLVIMFLTVPTVWPDPFSPGCPELTLARRNLPSGASKLLFPSRMSLKAAPSRPVWRTASLQRWRSYSTELVLVCGGPPRCTSMCATSWTASSSGARVLPPTTPASPSRCSP
jgi:sorting nexin-8